MQLFWIFVTSEVSSLLASFFFFFKKKHFPHLYIHLYYHGLCSDTILPLHSSHLTFSLGSYFVLDVDSPNCLWVFHLSSHLNCLKMTFSNIVSYWAASWLLSLQWWSAALFRCFQENRPKALHSLTEHFVDLLSFPVKVFPLLDGSALFGPLQTHSSHSSLSNFSQICTNSSMHLLLPNVIASICGLASSLSTGCFVDLPLS